MKPTERVSLQLYSGRFMESLEAQFAMLAGLGLKHVEPWGGLFADPQKLEGLLKKHGMTAPSAHVGLDRLRADAAGTAKLCRGLGIETLFVPAPPQGEREKDAAGWTAFGRELARIGKVVTGEGVKFGWHNHAFEYAPTAQGDLPMDIILAEAPDILWQVDLAWIVRGGKDPAAEMAKHTGRVASCHVKDIAPAGQNADEDGWADVGHGVLDWGTLLPAMRAAGCALFVLEHDKPNNAARFARRSLATLAAWN